MNDKKKLEQIQQVVDYVLAYHDQETDFVDYFQIMKRILKSKADKGGNYIYKNGSF